jgi:hypothetical protein
MPVDSENDPVSCWAYPARVLACLNTNRITVVVCPGQGLADGGVPYEIESSLIPLDLRIPNSEFFILIRKDTSEIVKILRHDEKADGSEFVGRYQWR